MMFADSTHMYSPAADPRSRRNLARHNAALLIAFIYLQDIFWLVASRTTFRFYEPLYSLASLEWRVTMAFVLFSGVFAMIGVVAAYTVPVVPRINVPRWMIIGAFLGSIVFSFLSVVLLESEARYTSGGLTGWSGVVFGIKQSAFLASAVILIRHRMSGKPFPNIWLFAVAGSYVLTIDGAASALTVFVFLVLALDLRLQNPRRLILFGLLGVFLGVLGISQKWESVPSYVSVEFFLQWVISRFSLHAEQMYAYLSGESMIGNAVSYLELLWRSNSNRFELVFGNGNNFEAPRNVSEALYHDMKQRFGSGSSPGALLGTALNGPFFFLFPILFTFFLVQYFYGITVRVGVIQLCSYSFLFKGLHANFPEYLKIISPTLLSVFLVAVGCLLIEGKRQPSKTLGSV